MATSMKKTTVATNDTATIKEQITNKKKFNDEDLIPCRSITNGKLIFVGKKSGMVYRWTDYNDVEYVEYRDLLFAVRNTNDNSIIYRPRFIIMDEDFIAENKKLAEFYKNIYTTTEFEELVMDCSVNQLIATVKQLPEGAKECLKGVVSTMISDGRLDSVKKIKVFDEIFDTNMLLMLANS